MLGICKMPTCLVKVARAEGVRHHGEEDGRGEEASFPFSRNCINKWENNLWA